MAGTLIGVAAAGAGVGAAGAGAAWDGAGVGASCSSTAAGAGVIAGGAALAALELLSTSGELLERLRENTTLFRTRMTEEGFDLLPGEHPIIPVMIGDAAKAGQLADLLLDQGIYVIGFSYPVVPHGKARIRTQMSAAHSTDDVHRAVDAFVTARSKTTP